MSLYPYNIQSFNVIANEDCYLAQISNEDKTNISNDSISSEKESIENKEYKLSSLSYIIVNYKGLIEIYNKNKDEQINVIT